MSDEKEKTGMKIGRRGFLKAGVAAAVGAGAAAAGYGFFVEPHNIEVTRTAIPIKNLPPAFDGFRIVHLTDIHHGDVIGLDYVEEAVKIANSLEPDLVALTGDYISVFDKYIEPVFEALSALRAVHGAAAVPGNHDHWVDAAATRSAICRAGFAELSNRHMRITKDGSVFIAGIDDLWEGVQAPDEAFRDIPAAAPRIVLTHNPDYAELLPERHRADLMLCGHTHGGQVNLPLLGAPIVPALKKYRAGLVRGPVCPVYVSRGLGMIKPPVRINCPPEIALLTLTPDADHHS